MSDDSVEARLTEIFRDVFDDEDIVVRSDLTARDVDGWDSLAHVRLVLTIERKFKIRFSAHEIASLKTAGDLIRLTEAKVAGSVA